MRVEWNGGIRKVIEPDMHPSRMGTEDCGFMFDNFLNTYFLDATSHHTGNDTPFTANFYHSQEFPRWGIEVKIPNGPSMGDTFIDRNSREPNILEGSPNIKLTYREYFIGVLCPETQTLWATDWTHGSGSNYRNCTRHIINYLVEQGLLRPVSTKKPEKPKVKKSPKKTEFAITIGGDPEFELVSDCGEVLRAGDEYRFEVDEVYGNIGLDGAGDQVELRPSPGEPEKVVENIRRLLETFGKDYGQKYRLAASSDEFPCGGHIHIGIKPLPNTTYYEKLANVLDDFIGRPTRKLNGTRRGESSSYGDIGDWRNQYHGMEYRTPPSAVWKNPDMARTVLKLTYNLAKSLANNLQLEYNNPTSTEDLISVGGLLPEEANFYLEECQKQAPHSSECLLAAWGVKVEPIKPPKPKIIVEFREDWNSEVKRILNNYLKIVEVTKNIHITCYGLKESRGDVYTFEMPGKDIIDHPQSRGLNATFFGFSKKFRRGSIGIPDIKDATDSITKVIMGIQNGEIPLKPVHEPVSYRPEDLPVDLSSIAESFEFTLR